MSQEVTKKALGLFFTTGVSLQTWIDVGNFDREKRIYEEHLDQGVLDEVHWFTYGSADEKLAEGLYKEDRLHKKIFIHQAPRFVSLPGGSFVYSLVLPLIRSLVLSKISLYKTNQMSGSWAAVLASRIYKKTLFIRTGYTWSLFAARQDKSWLKRKVIKCIESWSYACADVATVTSHEDKKYIVDTYSVAEKKIVVTPNYIDTDVFYDKSIKRNTDMIVSVTRLTPQKNLESVIRALPGSGFGLVLYYGGGELEEKLRSLAQEVGADVEFKGAVANEELPAILNQYQYFILPSLYEGMPKTLLEAMACGCVCGGTDVSGTKEVLTDKNGVLVSGTSVSDMKEMFDLLHDANVEQVSTEATETIVQDYSLVAIVQKEKDLFADLFV